MLLATTTGDLARYLPDKSVAAPLEALAETKFKNVDLSFYDILYPGSPWTQPGDGWKKEIEKAQELAARYHLTFCQAHSPDGNTFIVPSAAEPAILATNRTIEACGMLGIPCTVIHGQAVLGCTKEEFQKQNIRFYQNFEDAAEKYGVDLLTENSSSVWLKDYWLLSGAEMAEFIEKAALPRLHACWDTGHANVQDTDQYEDILALGSHLKAFHLQDNYGNTDSHIMPLAGTTNFDRILRAMIKTGYTGSFTFEGSNTLRRAANWPHGRKNVQPGDIIADPPLYIQQMQLNVMYEIGKWMLGSYGLTVE